MQLHLPKIFFTLLFFIATAVTAQVKFTASASAQQIAKNEMLQLRLAVENAGSVEQINPPDFSNFIIVSGPSQESGMTNINGTVSRYVALSYILKPKGPGTFVIAAATALADGKKLISNTLKIKVSNTVSAAAANNNALQGFNPFDDMPVQQQPVADYILKKGENAADKINRNMFVKLQTDKTSCYVGQPVIATYKLYTRLKSESNVVKNPSFSGFSVIDMQQPDNVNTTRETVNGKEYNVYVIRKVQLYPLQPGSLELEALQVENTVQFIKEEYAAKANGLMNDMFQEFAETAIPAEGIENKKILLQSKPVMVTVKPLPAEMVPAAFTGAVGNFEVKAGLEKNTFTTDDAGKLIVMVAGEGNMQLITAPDVKWPQGIEAFEPTTTDDIVKTTVPISGRKLLSWDFTVAQPGEYILPPVVFSYFSPATGKYKTDSTVSVKFTVTKGTGKKATVVINTQEKKNWLNKFFSNRRWVASSIAALIALGLLLWLKKDKRKEEKKAADEAAAIAAAVAVPEPEIVVPEITTENYLEKATQHLYEDSSSFYRELNAALKNYLSAKLKMPAATLNKKIIADELDKRNVSNSTVIQLQNLMNDIELQLYTPFAEREKMQELYNAAADTMQLLNTYKV